MSDEKEVTTDTIGGFPFIHPNCRGCDKPLTVENAWMTDGCPCNSELGVNNFNETRWRLLMQLQQNQQTRNAELAAECERLKVERDAYARESLIALAGAVATPEQGFVKDGGPQEMAACIRDLRTQLAAAKERERLLADRLSCACGELRNEEPTQAAGYAARINNGADPLEVVTEALSSWKAFYNIACEDRESCHRKLSRIYDQNDQLAAAQKTIADLQGREGRLREACEAEVKWLSDSVAWRLSNSVAVDRTDLENFAQAVKRLGDHLTAAIAATDGGV